MNEDEIKALFLNENKFRGCYALDEVPGIILQKNQGIIMNTSPRHINVGHWIAFYRDKYNKFYYIDSLALPEYLSNPHVKLFLIVNNVTFVNMLNHAIQPLTSSMCGLYASYFLLKLFNGVNFCKIADCFDICNLFVNDFYLSCYFRNKI